MLKTDQSAKWTEQNYLINLQSPVSITNRKDYSTTKQLLSPQTMGLPSTTVGKFVSTAPGENAWQD